MWIDPKTTPSAVPASSTTVHLDRLAEEVVREGWQAAPRYNGPHPLIHVFARDVPIIGESVTLVHGTTPDVWWYRSSTGEDLAPHTKPGQAAEQITRTLLPYVTAVRAARSRQRQTIGVTCAPPPTRPVSSHTPATINELRQRFADVICWWGPYTYEWWAIVPVATRWRIVNAEDPDTLVQRILNMRK